MSPAGRRRGPKVALDPWRPIRVLHERERLGGATDSTGATRSRGPAGPAGSIGSIGSTGSEGAGPAPALAIFLAGAECPFRCVFCDLWRETLDGPTPPGAIARQVEIALRELGGPGDLDGSGAGSGRRAAPGELNETVVKLYNASNFFDPRAVPEEDLWAVAALLAPARRVVVECHPRLILDGREGRGGDLCRRFAGALAGDAGGGAELEVAMGLETVHPEAFPRLDKGMALEDFGAAAARLREMGVLVRAFVLVGAPFVPPEEAVTWAVRSVEHALAAGATHVSLIPVRVDDGTGGPDRADRAGSVMAALAARGELTPPRLGQLEEALERSLRVARARSMERLGSSGREEPVITADLWDLERFATCASCLPVRRARLELANETGRLEPGPPISLGGTAAGRAGSCPSCGWSGEPGESSELGEAGGDGASGRGG